MEGTPFKVLSTWHLVMARAVATSIWVMRGRTMPGSRTGVLLQVMPQASS
jgi:hypothetical protein